MKRPPGYYPASWHTVCTSYATQRIIAILFNLYFTIITPIYTERKNPEIVKCFFNPFSLLIKNRINKKSWWQASPVVYWLGLAVAGLYYFLMENKTALNKQGKSINSKRSLHANRQWASGKRWAYNQNLMRSAAYVTIDMHKCYKITL